MCYTFKCATNIMMLGEDLYVFDEKNVVRIKFRYTRRIDRFPLSANPSDKFEPFNKASLYFDPALIPDDTLICCDAYRREVFTYYLSTKQKKTRLRGDRARSISYSFYNNKTFYVVTFPSSVKVYDSGWHFIRKIGSYGSVVGNFDNAQSALQLPEGTVVVADSGGVSEFTMEGMFVGHLLGPSDGISGTGPLSFHYPHLWILTHKVTRYRLYET